MADQKLTELDAFTPVLTDVIYGADDPGGTPVSGKITLSALNTLFGANIQVGATSQVTGLDTALSGKADSTHNQAASTITSGTLAHEQGGLEADVSAYSGLVKISGGTTSEAIAGTDYAAVSHTHTQSDVTGLTTADSPQFTGIELGHATDTTIARASAGQVTIEGVAVLTASNTATVTNKSIDATQLTGTIADARVAESSVTQHEAALTILSSQLSATGTASSATYLRGDNTWSEPGDMDTSVYDPQGVNGDAFVRANHTGVMPVDGIDATGTPGASNFLRGDGTWATPAGAGDVSKVGTPVDGQIGVWTGDGTIEGAATLTFDAGELSVVPGGTAPHAAFSAGSINAYLSSNHHNLVVATASATAEHSNTWYMQKAAGTIDAPSAVSSGHVLAKFLGGGYDGTSIVGSARLNFSVDGAVSTGVVPGSMQFQTGTAFANLTTRLNIASGGAITFNGAYTFPTSDGTADQVLKTDGAGNLSFGTVSGGGAGTVTQSGTQAANRVAYYTADETIGGEAAFTYDPATDTLAVTNLTVGGNAVAALADPGADAIAFWDDSAGATVYFTTLTGLSISGTTLSVSSASTTVAGRVELATTAETSTGTDVDRAVTPDGLAGSVFGEKEIAVSVFDSDTAVSTGDGVKGIPIPASFNGMNIVAVRAFVHTQGVTGSTDVQIRRRRSGTNVDVLSTKVTVGAEYHAADGVINASNDDLATGDMLFVDVDAVHSGTAPNGLSVAIAARLP